MLVPPSKHLKAFEGLIRSSSDSAVAIFVSLDCDSICCCNILTTILRLSHVRFIIHPVVGYRNLKEKFCDIIDIEKEINSVLFINNGATVDLLYLLCGEDEPIDKTFYIFDCHKPFDLSNVAFDNELVQMFCDKETSLQDFPEDDYVSDEDEKNLDEKEAKERFRKKKCLEEYYKGTTYAPSMALHLYEISRKMSLNNNNLLWNTIVALTDQLEHERISREQYVQMVNELQREVLLMNSGSKRSRKGTRLNGFDDGHIEFSEELKLSMYRHWNIYESLFNSRYIASHFTVWKQSGRRRLLDFIVKLAIPINESKRPFSAMDRKNQNGFSKRIKKLSKRFGLKDAFYGSFIRKIGNKNIISAGETVYAITALLSEANAESNADVDSFWRAYDCLNKKNLCTVLEGIDSSKRIWRAIVRQCNTVLEKRTFTSSGRFRYVVIDDLVDHSLISSFSNLLSVALLLADLFDASSRHKNRALVVCLLNKVKGVYSVLGIPTKRHGEFCKNRFGAAFRKAAEETDCRYRQERFESNFLEIRKEDKTRFIDYLQSVTLEV